MGAGPRGQCASERPCLCSGWERFVAAGVKAVCCRPAVAPSVWFLRRSRLDWTHEMRYCVRSSGRGRFRLPRVTGKMEIQLFPGLFLRLVFSFLPSAPENWRVLCRCSPGKAHVQPARGGPDSASVDGQREGRLSELYGSRTSAVTFCPPTEPFCEEAPSPRSCSHERSVQVARSASANSILCLCTRHSALAVSTCTSACTRVIIGLLP